MKKSITAYVMVVCSAIVLAAVLFIFNKNPMGDGGIPKLQQDIEDVQTEVDALTKKRNALQTAYNRAVKDGQSIDISGEVEPFPVFLYMTEERQKRDVAITQGVAKAYLSYRLLGDSRYLNANIGEYKFLSGVKLDVSHLDDVFTANLGKTSRVADSYKAAPYAMASDEAVSYYAVFYYTNNGSNTTTGILFDITITKGGSIQSAIAHNVYPD